MRVCQIIESAGGSFRVALDLTKHLLAAGDDVTFIYSPARAEENFLEEIKTIEGVKFIPLQMKRNVGLYDLFFWIKLYFTLKKEGPFDVMHAHSSKAGGLMRLVSLALPKVVRVYTPHAFITMSPSALRIYGWLEKILSYCTEAIIAVSQSEKDHAVKQLHIESALVHVVPNGVSSDHNVSRAEACNAIGFSAEDFIVGFVGRFVEQKCPLRMVEAFALVLKQKPQAKLVMVGNGCLIEQVLDYVVDNGLDKHVVFKTNHNARPLMPAFDVLCCSSDYEGNPLIFMEALLAGVPVVTTPVGGSYEAIIPGRTGYIADFYTPTALAIAVMKIATQTPEEKATMKLSAREHGGSFTVKRMGKTVRTLYQNLLGVSDHGQS